MTILVCAQHFEEDPHINRVCHYIKLHKGNYIFMERYRNDHLFSFNVTNNKSNLFFKNEIEEFDLIENVKSVFWRIKPVISSELPAGKSNEIEKFCAAQWMGALHSFASLFKDILWVNNLYDSKLADSKITQLKTAQELGFNIPKTIISNDKEKILSFFNDKPNIIFKLLSPFTSETHNIFTNEVSYETLIFSKNALTMAPTIFQEKIDKEYEIRITVVGNKIYSMRVDAIDKIDWRKVQDPKIFSEIKIPKDLENKIIAFQKIFNLSYGSYDFIVDRNGNYFFLECNPSGQWFFNEDTGDQIAEQVALILLGK
jgi:glutathione synthase/RimK-type ligase-like ATP-grasp enzyme